VFLHFVIKTTKKLKVMNNLEQVLEWFEKYDAYDYTPKIRFEDVENKLHECKQVASIMFLASKLKDKNEEYFLHGEHDVLYIGSSFDIFENFTEEDVKIAVAYGISVADDGDGFQIYASM